MEKNLKTKVPPLKHTQLCDRYYFIMTKRIQDNSMTHGLNTFKLLPLLDLLQFTHIIQ